MKKAVKGLIIAASVASVVGIGAVSFAAWTGATDKDVTVTGTTGSIITIGALTVTPKADTYTTVDSAIVMNALMPVDQGTGLTYWEFKIESTTTGDATVTFSLEGSIAKGDNGTAVGSAALYWTKTQPTNATKAEDGTAVAASAAALTNVASGDTVYIYMVAGNTDAMKADITLKFSAAATAASGS